MESEKKKKKESPVVRRVIFCGQRFFVYTTRITFHYYISRNVRRVTSCPIITSIILFVYSGRYNNGILRKGIEHCRFWRLLATFPRRPWSVGDVVSRRFQKKKKKEQEMQDNYPVGGWRRKNILYIYNRMYRGNLIYICNARRLPMVDSENRFRAYEFG